MTDGEPSFRGFGKVGRYSVERFALPQNRRTSRSMTAEMLVSKR